MFDLPLRLALLYFLPLLIGSAMGTLIGGGIADVFYVYVAGHVRRA